MAPTGIKLSDIGWTGQLSGRPNFGRVRHPRQLDAAGPKNAKHCLARRDQIVGDDPPMTSPP
jgi:hypothetical protein